MKTLAIAPDVTTPIELVTEKLAFLGRTGSGKTYGAQKVAELMLEAGAQIIALDPVGPWHGLRVAGKGPAFDIPVFGGLKGDVPLEPSAGVIIADLVCDRGISAVLDVSQMTHSEQLQFANDFGTRLFQRKKASPSALHFFIEECQEFIPQNPGHGNSPKCLSTYQRIVKLGRNFGIGCSLITQRPQAVSKEALNMTEVLFAFQMTGPQERATMVKWMGELGDRKTAEEITNSLPKLFDHRCIIWSPSWLKINLTTRVYEKRTADVSSTPKVGAKSKVAQALTPIDLEALRETMAATIEKAKADDPKLLRVRVAELEKQLKNAEAHVVTTELEIEVPTVPTHVFDVMALAQRSISAAIMALNDAVRACNDVAGVPIGQRLNGISSRDAFAQKTLERDTPTLEPTQHVANRNGTNAAALSRRAEAPKSAAPPRGNGIRDPRIGKGALLRVLTALAQRNGLTNRQLGLRAGVSSRSSTFTNNLAAARTNGWLRDDGPRRFITPEGVAALGSFDPLPEGPELLAFWLNELGATCAARVLSALADAHPSELSKETLGERAECSIKSSTFTNNMARLRDLELIVGGERGQSVRASEELFS